MKIMKVRGDSEISCKVNAMKVDFQLLNRSRDYLKMQNSSKPNAIGSWLTIAEVKPNLSK
jgi:hypothetical protein